LKEFKVSNNKEGKLDSRKSQEIGSARDFTRREVIKAGAAGLAGVAAASLAGAAAAQSPQAASGSADGVLQGQVAFVSGAGRNIGRAIALALAGAGADITAVDIADPNAIPSLSYPLASLEDLAETQRLVQARGRRCLVVQADIRNMGQMREAAERTIRELGSIDILVANAGVVPSAPLVEMTDEQWRDPIEVNLTGTANAVRAVLPHMVERERGRIVAITSTNGRQGSAGNAHYVASKWGIVGLIKAAALEAGPHNVTVNGIAPTAVESIRFPTNPEEREAAEQRLLEYNALPIVLLKPSDVADSVLFLVSPQARYITGAVLDVAAGANARYTA
jgi:NAD(P)-dependent dehydrogenase (short-subunit alcohol dehydrogenase family)